MSETERAKLQQEGLLKPMRPGVQATGNGLARPDPVVSMSEIELPAPAAVWRGDHTFHLNPEGMRLEQWRDHALYTAEQVRQAVLAERAEVERLSDVLETLAAQSSGVVGSTSRADCMAAMAAAAIRR